MSPLVRTASMDLPERTQDTMTTIDRKPDMTTIISNGTRRTVASPFFIGAVAMTVVLALIAVAVAIAS